MYTITEDSMLARGENTSQSKTDASIYLILSTSQLTKSASPSHNAKSHLQGNWQCRPSGKWPKIKSGHFLEIAYADIYLPERYE